MERREVLKGLGALGVLVTTSVAAAAPRLVVIVNPKNPVGSIDSAELAAIFTTRKVYWSSSLRITAFNLPARSSLRELFDELVLHLTPDQVARYWIDRRIRGGDHPPRIVPDPGLVLRLVAELPGAIGYVPRDIADGTVKVVAEVGK